MNTTQQVTDKILELLSQGQIPWHRPWCSAGGAFNRVSGQNYSLLNQLLLRHSGEYASLKQWNNLGGRIRRGEKAEHIVFWKLPEYKPQEDGDADENKSHKYNPILIWHPVFHISQVEGVETLARPAIICSEPVSAAEILFRNYVSREGIALEEEMSNNAFYIPSQDLIHIPAQCQYSNKESFLSVAFHEAVHSSGNISRLNRDGLKKASFGSTLYSQEELIAEIGSATLLHEMGIQTEAILRNNTAYIQGWLKALKNDQRMIIVAAAQAEKAIRFIRTGEMT